MQFTSLILVQIGLAALASADCCGTVTTYVGQYRTPVDSGYCRDHTDGTPCCGFGQCNIFCCNCDGGCRYGDYNGKRDDSTSAAPTPDSLFQSVDGDNNDEMTLGEYIGWVSDTQGDVANNATLLDKWVEKFNIHDVNKDGKISAAEVEAPS